MKQRVKAYLVHNEEWSDWDVCTSLKVARLSGVSRMGPDNESGVLACIDEKCAERLFGKLDRNMVYILSIVLGELFDKPESNRS